MQHFFYKGHDFFSGATCTVANGPSSAATLDALTTGECRFLENQDCIGGKCECKANCGRDASGLCMPGIGKL